MQTNLALIIDRDEAVRSLLAEVLRDEGWQSVTLPMPPAHDTLADLHPALIILELWQSQSACELLSELKLRHDESALPLMLTSTDAELLEQLRSDDIWHAYTTLLKPFGVNELLHAVTRTVGPQRA